MQPNPETYYVRYICLFSQKQTLTQILGIFFKEVASLTFWFNLWSNIKNNSMVIKKF